MPRIPRLSLVLFTVAVLVLVSVPLAGARPLETSLAAQRTESGWFTSALKWMEELAGFVRSTAERATGSPVAMPGAMQKGGNTPMGGSCLDPHGNCG
jgi:hypothetical protein